MLSCKWSFIHTLFCKIRQKKLFPQENHMEKWLFYGFLCEKEQIFGQDVLILEIYS